MATILFKDLNDGKILVLNDIKERYAEKNDSDLPISDAEIIAIALLDKQNYKVINDDILNWCNDYSIFCEADRYLSYEELDLSIRNIYIEILEKDKHVDGFKNYLRLNHNSESEELLERLEQLLGK